jgi:DNA-binding transcriptional LysR family regulator
MQNLQSTDIDRGERMRRIDLNRLIDLEALLSEGSVTGAAKRLHLSAPAMSRRLSSLREAMGDPLFVLAGRRLVPTEKALALRERVRAVIEDVRGILTPSPVDFTRVERILTLRASDGFFGAWAARLTARVAADAPGITLHFRPRTEKGREVLRSGEVDLDLGTLGNAAPEIKSQLLLKAKFVGVVRTGHPLLNGRIDKGRLVQWPHIAVSEREHVPDPVAGAPAFARRRRVVAEAPGFQSALAMVACSEWVAIVPEPFAQWSAEHGSLSLFELPIATPKVDIAMSWHPRNHADPINCWLRDHVRAVSRK